MGAGNLGSLTGKTVVVTGGTSGIGESTALHLSRAGANVVIVGRDSRRNDAALARLRGNEPRNLVEARQADLSLQSGVRALAEDLLRSYPRIDGLINNAGALFTTRELTSEGVERTLALNVVAPFLLTELLADRLISSGAARVVNVASDAHRRGRMNFNDLQAANSYSGYRVYCNSKLALMLLTKQFLARFEGSKVTVNAANPGRVNTSFGRGNPGLFAVVLRTIQRVIGIPPEVAARTVTYAVVAPELATTTGRYISKERLAEPSFAATDSAAASRLWVELARLTGLPPAS